ncbi:hypothetical protein CTM58_07375 [Prevotella intermedia]|uniref:Uncharacterized protein n=1 Tax=Prevotella intermedia TaxID=28131 RepID=A0A2M8TVE4_PREIN|nr:hypothetical protein CBG55_06860 [Prevotella intermedia]PJI25791.1 hypothetical protein CTM59_06925 [Prevotella intermedia]PJI27898.1 hypothetical protein CTM58_07375 [Prevotella intermedia]
MPLKLNNLGMYLFPLNNKDIDGLQGNRVFPAIYNILYLVRADISLIYIVIKSLFKYFNIRACARNTSPPSTRKEVLMNFSYYFFV